MLEMYIIAKTGKKTRKIKANSFVKNFLTALYSSLVNQFVSLVDINGNVVSNTGLVCYGSGAMVAKLLLNAPEGDDTYGIVVGTGTVPVSPDDYKLEQKIAHGSGDGLLYYYPCNVLDLEIDGNRVIQKIQRQFENKGTVDIDIKEIGLQALIKNKNNATYKVLIVRDVLSEPIPIPSGGTAVLEVWLVTEV